MAELPRVSESARLQLRVAQLEKLDSQHRKMEEEVRKSDGKALHESEKKYRLLFEEAMDAIVVASAETGLIIGCNRAATLLWGREKSELVGQHQRILHPPDEIEGGFSRTFRQHLQRKKGRVLEAQAVTKNGEIKDVEIMANVFELGGQRLIQGIFREITERKRMQEELRNQRDELETLVEQRTRQLVNREQCLAKERAAVVRIVGEMRSGHLQDAEIERQVLNACLDATNSVHGMIGVVNEQGRWEATNFISRTPSDRAFPEASAGELATGRDIRGIWGWPILHGEPLICNDLHNHPDRVGLPNGHMPIESFLGVPIKRQSKVAGMVAVANKPGGFTQSDIETLSWLVDVMVVSRRHRELLAEVRTARIELEKRVGERTAQLELVNKELEAFSYSVSHDLRAPLRAIDGYVRILVEDFEPRLDAEGKRICSVINESARIMGRLIDDLLKFSSFSHAEIRPSQIDMKKLATSIFYELAMPESRERIDFRIGSLPRAKGDPIMIRQVWTNLISNAIKFSSGRERAIIEVNGERNGRESIYWVKDNGAGFDMQYAQKLFVPFQRLHSMREFEGTGVGLAIIQRIIRRHGGRVWAKGEIDNGAVFYFTLQQGGRQP